MNEHSKRALTEAVRFGIGYFLIGKFIRPGKHIRERVPNVRVLNK